MHLHTTTMPCTWMWHCLVFCGGHGIWKCLRMSLGNALVWHEAPLLSLLAPRPTGSAKEKAAEVLRGLQLRGKMLSTSIAAR